MMNGELLDNDGRANFAAAALATYHSETRFSPDTYGDEGSAQFVETFGDLLGDLQHLAKRAGVDFAQLLAAGTGHFECEVGEEEEAERQEALKLLPLDEQVYEALTENHMTFSTLGIHTGAEKKALAEALYHLHTAGRAEMYPGLGWRRVTVPLEERVLAWLSEDEPAFLSSIEVDHLIEENQLRDCLEKLRQAGLVEATQGGWRRTPVADGGDS